MQRMCALLLSHSRAVSSIKPDRPSSLAREVIEWGSLRSSQPSTVLGASRPSPSGALRAALTHLRAAL